MANRVFGKLDLHDNHRPTKGRLSLLEFVKKTISYFMQNRLMKRDMTNNNSRNPIKLVTLNEFNKHMKKER